MIKGYKVLVGINKEGGVFNYFRSKKDAQKWGKIIKESFGIKKLKVYLIPMKLKKCDMDYCDELTELNEKYCLSCGKLILDTYLEKNEI